jgi:hypothetical protein
MGRIVVVFAVAALVLCPSRAGAQVEVGVSAGAFWPLGAGWKPDVGLAGQVERRQIAAHIVGARLAYWSGNRLGVEATLGLSPSQVAVSDVGRIRDIGGRVVMSSLRVLTRLASLTDGKPGAGFSHWDINAGAGAGIISRSGTAWANVSGTTHPAAVLTLEFRTPLAKAATIRAGLEDWVSWATFDRGLQSETRWRVQHDVIFSLAAQLRVGKRRGVAR